MITTTVRMRLVRVYDVREIDEMTGQRIPLDKRDGEGHTCERCGKLHAKVYVVSDGATEHEVGSTCCKRLFGWTPAPSDVRYAEQRDADKARDRAAQRVADWMRSLDVPAIEDCGEACRIDRDFGMIVRVFGAAGIFFLFNPNGPDYAEVGRQLADGRLQRAFADRYRARKATERCGDEHIRNRAFAIYNGI